MTLAEAKAFSITNNISFMDACGYLGLGILNSAEVNSKYCSLLVANIPFSSNIIISDCFEINVLNTSISDPIIVNGATLPFGKSINLKSTPGKMLPPVSIATGLAGTVLYSTIKN